MMCKIKWICLLMAITILSMAGGAAYAADANVQVTINSETSTYATWAAAMEAIYEKHNGTDAAVGVTSTTVTLLNDIIVDTDGDDDISISYPMTLDFDGKTMTLTGNSCLPITASNVVLQDSENGGGVTSSSANGLISIYGYEDADAANVVIRGGTYVRSGDEGYGAVQVGGNSTVAISGGTFKAATEPIMINGSGYDEKTSVAITGGSAEVTNTTEPGIVISCSDADLTIVDGFSYTNSSTGNLTLQVYASSENYTLDLTGVSSEDGFKVSAYSRAISMSQVKLAEKTGLRFDDSFANDTLLSGRIYSLEDCHSVYYYANTSSSDNNYKRLSVALNGSYETGDLGFTNGNKSFAGWYSERSDGTQMSGALGSTETPSVFKVYAQWKNSVAKVTDTSGKTTYHESLSAAFNKANNNSGSTITLLMDCNENETVHKVANDAEFNIDLNGFTLTSKQFLIEGTVKVDDSSQAKTGTVIDAYANVTVASGGKLIIKAGNWKNTSSDGWVLSSENGAEVVIEGGTFVDFVGLKGNTTITGGNFQDGLRLGRGGSMTISGDFAIINKYLNKETNTTLDMEAYNNIEGLCISFDANANTNITLPENYGYQNSSSQYPQTPSTTSGSYYIKPVVEVTFDYGNSKTEVKQAFVNGSVEMPDTSSVDSFHHWSTSKTGGTEVTASTTFAAATTVYAQYGSSIVLDTNGGTLSADDFTLNTDDGNYHGSYIHGNGKTLPTNVSRTGYTFGGWYEDESFSGNACTLIGTDATGAKTYYAKWMGNAGIAYKVIHHFEDIHSPVEGEYKWDGDTAARTENKSGTAGAQTEAAVLNPVPEGFTERGTSPVTTAAPPPISQEVIEGDGSTEVDLYYTRNEYVLTIDPDNQTEETTYWFRYGASIANAIPDTLSKTDDTGYTYVQQGWLEVELDENGNPKTDADGKQITTKLETLPTTMPAKNMRLRANWGVTPGTVSPAAAAYYVQHYKKNASGTYDLAEQEQLVGEIGKEVVAVAKSYTGFSVNEETSTQTETLVKPTTGTDGPILTTLKMYYDPIEYAIAYDLDGGALPENQSNPSSYTVLDSFTLANPELAGYTFAGWTGTDLTQATTTVEIEVGTTGTLSYTATWTANTNTAYTVKHHFQNADDDGYTLHKSETLYGTTGAAASYSALTGDEITGFELATKPSTTPTYIQGNGGTVIDLYYDRLTYTLTFKLGHEQKDIVKENVRYGAKVTAPETPVQEGYTFLQWSAKGYESVPATMPNSDLIVEAVWAANAGILDVKSAYQVKHFKETLDGTYLEVLEDREFPLYAKEGELVSATAKTYEGFELNTEKSTTSDTLIKPYQGTDGQPVLTTLECYYDRKNVKITIEIEDGEDIVIEGVYGEEIPEPTPPAKDDHEFSHWEDEDGNPVTFPLPMPSEDLIIHPVYTGYPPVFIVPTEALIVSVFEGQQATLEAKATNNPDYQWYISYDNGLNWKAIEGATSPVYTSSVTKLSNNGYLYYCQASNKAGSAKSEIFQLEVLQQVTLPETGDNSHVEWHMLLCTVCFAGIVILLQVKRKQNNEQN